MKNLSGNLLTLFVLVIGLTASAATAPIDVTVSKSDGAVAYKGKTGPIGTFATPELQAGNYVVQLKAKDATGVYALVISAGKKKVSANAVAGEKLGRGVAMKLELAVGSKITGQVAEANGEITTSNGVRVKIENGKRYLWVASGTGSNLGGHWVEEGTPEALNINSVSKKSINDMQERARAQREGE